MTEKEKPNNIKTYRCQMQNGNPCKSLLDGGFCSQRTQFRCIEYLKTHLPRLSQSSIQSFSRCPQLYYLSQVVGLRKKPHHASNPLKAGSLWDTWISNHNKPELKTKMREVIEKYQIDNILIAKIRGLAKAAKALEIKLPGKDQYQISFPVAGTSIYGKVDRADEYGFAEDKLSGRPDFYTNRGNIDFQCGTYFMAEERFDYVDMCVVRLPELRTGKGNYADESIEAYTNRVYQDIIKRPSHYFLKFNREDRTYGMRFYRSEFDLENLFRIYVILIKELERFAKEELWYPRSTSCYCPGPCDFLDVCTHGIVSELIYEYRQKTDEDDYGRELPEVCDGE